jgi:isopentenyldiphosphate isomerase
VHRRTPTKDVYPDHWDVTVGGVVESGESYETAARRELAEELGVDAMIDVLGPMRYEDARTRVIGMVFLAWHDGPFRLQPEEIVDGRFISAAECERLIASEPTCPDGVLALRSYADRLRTRVQ